MLNQASRAWSHAVSPGGLFERRWHATGSRAIAGATGRPSTLFSAASSHHAYTTNAPRHTAHERDLTSAISPSAWEVLYALRGRGHESYVVGGTVRDYLLGAKTKDVDLTTSATPEQISGLFPRSRTIGRRFPIIHVRQGREIIEVSSFRTGCDEKDASAIPLDWYQRQQLKAACAGVGRRRRGTFRDPASATDEWDASTASDWSVARRNNAMKRDFTINGLLYEPFSRVLFDYVGGLDDCERRLLRTISPPDASFREDPARILRAVRLKARLGLDIEEATAHELENTKGRILDLSHGRLQMELGAMFAYGSAEATYRALDEYDLLKMLLPHHARQGPAVPMEVLRLMDECVHSLHQPLASITYNGSLFTMLVLADMAQGDGIGVGKLAAIDVVDECFERVTAPKQMPKQLLARKSLEQTTYLLREQLLLRERGAVGIRPRKNRRRRGERGERRERMTATSVLEEIISRALMMAD